MAASENDQKLPSAQAGELAGRRLFAIGFLALFLELAAIRWFAATVVFLQFFTNVILIACFLGLSCGCLAARQRRDWLSLFPLTALGAVVAALAVLAIYSNWQGIAIDVGHQASPQEIFFGTEYRNPDVSRFAIPIEAIAAAFFLLVAVAFVGLGQALGRAFAAFPDPVMGYTLNIAGSLAGVAVFSLVSWGQAPPWVWFLVVSAGVGWLLRETGQLDPIRALALACVVIAVQAPSLSQAALGGIATIWSPYYAVEFNPANRHITVNTIGHQQIIPFDEGGSSYSLIHLLERASGGAPLRDVLVIGAGSGNDVEHALRQGSERIDAVEIDPAIAAIGAADNPDRPYADPRVFRHLDDGRRFLRTTERKYDLVVYALLDSLILHSGYANIRLEIYLFTEEALADVKRVLKPGGVFVAYNYFRQGWVVERLEAMGELVFGCKPMVLTLPYQEALSASGPAGFAMVIGGCGHPIAAAFERHPAFWLNALPPKNDGVDGFQLNPETLPAAERANWFKIAPTAIVHDSGAPRFVTDDWPFLYLHDRAIPDLTIRSTALIGFIGLGLVYLFVPKSGRRFRIDGRMFFLGAAFMLLETKAVVQLALLFGSTWVVNSAVFLTALVLILLANLYVLKRPQTRLVWPYCGLIALLVAASAVPVDAFLAGSVAWRYAFPCALALGPMAFAGVIFALSFRDTPDPDIAFGSNIAGSVVGGLGEAVSMLVGFRSLLLIAIAFYLLSAAAPHVRARFGGLTLLRPSQATRSLP